MKKVIHIGGTSYSGSTLLDMTLANDPKGFSCGEVHAIFHPFRNHHLSLHCGCGDSECDVWEQIRAGGATRLYQEIFRLFPEVEFVVDSSKPPVWIMDQILQSKSTGIEVVNLLIWKTPEEFYASRAKRGEVKGWATAWINYYRMYFASIPSWVSVRYADLINNSSVLERLCQAIDIPYFPDKHEYWRKTQHTLFGNSSAKIHLYDASSVQYGRLQGELRQIEATRSSPGRSEHRRIHYRAVSQRAPDVSADERVQFERIQSLLEATDAATSDAVVDDVYTQSTEMQRKPLIHRSHAMLKRGTYRAMRRAATARVHLMRHPFLGGDQH